MRCFLFGLISSLTAILIHHRHEIFTANDMASTSNDPQKAVAEEKKQNDDIEETLYCKSIVKKFEAHSQKEGAGFIVNRPIGGRGLDTSESDPFLMLDELGPKMYKKGEFEGAPWHPHRGFDTVMYMVLSLCTDVLSRGAMLADILCKTWILTETRRGSASGLYGE